MMSRIVKQCESHGTEAEQIASSAVVDNAAGDKSDAKTRRADRKYYNLVDRLGHQKRMLEISFYNTLLGIAKAVPELEQALIFVDDSDKDAGVWPVSIHPKLKALAIGEIPDFTPYLTNTARQAARIAELEDALRNVLPYATACVGLGRPNWPSDSVILKAEELLA